jgi:hypothetical protein
MNRRGYFEDLAHREKHSFKTLECEIVNLIQLGQDRI